VFACIYCGGRVHRRKRAWWERVWRLEALVCEECGKRSTVLRPYLNLLSLKVHCPTCGEPRVEKLHRRDRIEALYWHPLSLLQGLAGASLYWCAHCRLQFYDFRKPLGTSPPAPGQAAVPRAGDPDQVSEDC
jgi:hypothetical protein